MEVQRPEEETKRETEPERERSEIEPQNAAENGSSNNNSNSSSSDSSNSSSNSNSRSRSGRGRSICAAFKMMYHRVMAVAVRGMLMMHALLCVWLVVNLRDNSVLWALASLLLFLVLDTVYSVVRRKGQESKWFCPCLLAYLIAALPPVWLIELYRFGKFQEAMKNHTAITDLALGDGLTVPVTLEPEVLVSLMEQTLLFIIIVARWLLPRGEISRHDLSQLLFVFVGIASDNMGLFELFDEEKVRKDPTLTYVIMVVWSFSFVQFLFVLTATKSPQQTGVLHDCNAQRQPRNKAGLLEILFTTESWSLLFSVLTQDGPYATVRIYAVVKHNLITYSIIFFICKNLFVVCLIFYRLTVVCLHMSGDQEDDVSSGTSIDHSSKNGKKQ